MALAYTVSVFYRFVAGQGVNERKQRKGKRKRAKIAIGKAFFHSTTSCWNRYGINNPHIRQRYHFLFHRKKETA